MSLARVSKCDGGRTHTAVSNSKSDEAQYVFSPRGELKPGSTLTTGSGVTEPELPAMHVRNKYVQFVSAAPRDREEVRMWGGRGGEDEHVANRTMLDLEVEWCDGVVTTFHPGSSYAAFLIKS